MISLNTNVAFGAMLQTRLRRNVVTSTAIRSLTVN